MLDTVPPAVKVDAGEPLPLSTMRHDALDAVPGVMVKVKTSPTATARERPYMTDVALTGLLNAKPAQPLDCAPAADATKIRAVNTVL